MRMRKIHLYEARRAVANTTKNNRTNARGRHNTWYYKLAKMIVALTCLYTGCTIVPHKSSLSLDKNVELDKRAIEDVKIGIKLEWIR